MSTRKIDPPKEYDRAMLRSAFVSLFWNVIAYKKAHEGYSLKAFADGVGVDKSAPSRWFSDDRPNWTANTMADIAGELGVDLNITAIDRQSGVRFTSHGVVPGWETSAPNAPQRPDEEWVKNQPPPPRTAGPANDDNHVSAESIMA